MLVYLTSFFLSCLLLSPFSVYSTYPESEDFYQFDIALSAECEPLTSVAGCVNVISGRLFQIEHDFLGNTIDPLHLTRYYDSGNPLESFFGVGFGCQFALFASPPHMQHQQIDALISEREGFLMPYKGIASRSSEYHCHVASSILKKGYTNLNCLAGQSNFRNWQAVFSVKDHAWIVTKGDGSCRHYTEKLHLNSIGRLVMNWPTHTVYLLTEEVKANGNRLRFEYDTQGLKPRLKAIRTLNSSATIVLNTIEFEDHEDHCTLTSNCGQSITYYKKGEKFSFWENVRQAKNVLQAVTFNQKGSSTNYQTVHAGQALLLTRIDKPQGTYLDIHYNQMGQVKSLQEPVGPDGSLFTTYQFHYGDHYTSVKNAVGDKTFYTFDDHQRIILIADIEGHQPDLFALSHQLRAQHFSWNPAKGKEGWLKAKALVGPSGFLHLTTYDYDKQGNVEAKTFYGNLTGHHLNTAFKQQEEAESYKLKSTYSQGGRNLLLEQETPEGLKKQYTYWPGTNLCAKELHLYDGKIQERTFRFYDDNGQLHTLIEDDGNGQEHTDLSNVTWRRHTAIASETNLQSASFGKPKTQIEHYLTKEGTLAPLKRIEFTYTTQGLEESQEVYNAANQWCYAVTKTYNAKQQVEYETDVLGYTTRYAYDEQGRKKEEEWVGLNKTTFYVYDAGGRLIEKKEVHPHIEYVTTYHYNTLHQLISEIDPYGQETTYHYDRLGRQIKCEKPFVQDENEQWVRPTTRKEYNLLDQVTVEWDEKENPTTYVRNSYGSPILITYCDRASERLTYYSNGWLKQKWDVNGTSVSYTYDPKGRVLTETTWNAKGDRLKHLEYNYKGPLLQFKKDHMTSRLITYHYDRAGRKTEEREQIEGQLPTKIKRYTLDDFGRAIQVEHVLDQESNLKERYTYDSLDRVTSHTQLNNAGQKTAQTIYQYDRTGHCVEKAVWCLNEEFANYRAHYLSDGSLAWKQDPLQNTTHWHFQHRHPYPYGHFTRHTTCQDPLGRLTLEEEDALHRVVKREIRLEEIIYSNTQLTYDVRGHLVKQTAEVRQEGQLERIYQVLRHYNARGFLEAETELPAHKTTCYFYDGKGLLKEKIKPDGIRLTYTHDALDRLRELTSSDGTVHYTYTYDKKGNLEHIEDHIHQLKQTRSYDALQRLIQEILSPGITLSYDYDALDRLIKLTLPDGSFTAYIYDGWYLKEIQRYQANGQFTYKHTCLKYNGRGQLSEEQSPVSLMTSTYDLLGRCIKRNSPLIQIEADAFDAAGNLQHYKQEDPTGLWQNTLTYDPFYHVKSENEAHYSYDSLGNCTQKNDQTRLINTLNQVEKVSDVTYQYDLNGNLETEITPAITYTYDALDRLILIEKEGRSTHLTYDAFNRCLLIQEESGSKSLLYQKEEEIGSLVNGHLHELRLIHPVWGIKKVFAVELQGQAFFPFQDLRGNICALQKTDGTLAEWARYSAFNNKQLYQAEKFALKLPWRFANRREIEGLVLFTHRLYHPNLMRWLTPDPAGFVDGLNLYSYVHNNPFYYEDKDGRFAFVLALPVIYMAFGTTGIAISAPTVGAIAGTIVGAVLGWGVYEACKQGDKVYNQIEANEPNFEIKKEEQKKKPKAIYAPDRPLPQDNKHNRPTPDVNTSGPHTQLGTRDGRNGKYPQAREFDKEGNPVRDIDFTDHGYPENHPNPHQHLWQKNQTGGTPKRSDALSLQEWEY